MGSFNSKTVAPAKLHEEKLEVQQCLNKTWSESAVSDIDAKHNLMTYDGYEPHGSSTAVIENEILVGTCRRIKESDGLEPIQRQTESKCRIQTAAQSAEVSPIYYHFDSVQFEEKHRKICDSVNMLSSKPYPVKIKEELHERLCVDRDNKTTTADAVFVLKMGASAGNGTATTFDDNYNLSSVEDLKNKNIKQELIEENSKLTVNNYINKQPKYQEHDSKEILQDSGLIPYPFDVIDREKLVGKEHDKCTKEEPIEENNERSSIVGKKNYTEESVGNNFGYKCTKEEPVEAKNEKSDMLENKIKKTMKWIRNPFAAIAAVAKEYGLSGSAQKNCKDGSTTKISVADSPEMQDANVNALDSQNQTLWSAKVYGIKEETQCVGYNDTVLDCDLDGNSDFHSLCNTSLGSLPKISNGNASENSTNAETPKWMVKLPKRIRKPLKNIVQRNTKENEFKAGNKPRRKQNKNITITESIPPNVTKPKITRRIKSKTKSSKKLNQTNIIVGSEISRKKLKRKRNRRVIVADKSYCCPIAVKKLNNIASRSVNDKMRACKKRYLATKQIVSFPKPLLDQKPQIVTPPAPIKIPLFKSENEDIKCEGGVQINYEYTRNGNRSRRDNEYEMDYIRKYNRNSNPGEAHDLKNCVKTETNYDGFGETMTHTLLNNLATSKYDMNSESVTSGESSDGGLKPNLRVSKRLPCLQSIEGLKYMNFQQQISTKILKNSMKPEVRAAVVEEMQVLTASKHDTELSWEQNKLLKSMQPRVCIKRLSFSKHLGSSKTVSLSRMNNKNKSMQNEETYEKPKTEVTMSDENNIDSAITISKNVKTFSQLVTNQLNTIIPDISIKRKLLSAAFEDTQSLPSRNCDIKMGLGLKNKLLKWMQPKVLLKRCDGSPLPAQPFQTNIKDECIINRNFQMNSIATATKDIDNVFETDMKKQLTPVRQVETPPLSAVLPIRERIKNETTTNIDKTEYLRVPQVQSILEMQRNWKLLQPKVRIKRMPFLIDCSRPQVLNTTNSDFTRHNYKQPRVRLKRLNWQGVYRHSLPAYTKHEFNIKEATKIDALTLNLQPVVRLRRLKLCDFKKDYSTNNPNFENHTKQLMVDLEVKRECEFYDAKEAHTLRKRKRCDIQIKEEQLSPKRSAEIMTSTPTLRISEVFSLHPVVRLKRLKCTSKFNNTRSDLIMQGKVQAAESATQIKMEALEFDDEEFTPISYAKRYEEEDSGISLDSTYNANISFDSDTTENAINNEFKQQYWDDGILFEIALQRACINDLLLQNGYSPIHFRLYNDIDDLKIFLNYLLDE